MSARQTAPLSIFEAPREFVVPLLHALRMSNTALDSLFYDINVFWSELFLRGTAVVTASDSAPHVTKAFAELNLGALSNPEGSILVIDAGKAPYVRRFDDVPGFLEFANGEGRSIKTVTVTGVGSSALGSAAFAWNVSVTLGEPVAAIVPGYGVADVIQQGLGGWFGFGFTSWIKKNVQETLAHMAPETAKLGRGLMMTVPGVAKVETGAPVFQRGSGSSDVLHEILVESKFIGRLCGHSKGALVIGNAIRDLPEATSEKLEVVTFGCPVSEDERDAEYMQFLGLLDGLGWLNSWGNRPEAWPVTHHSTNTLFPLSMPVSLLTRIAVTEQAAGARKRVNPQIAERSAAEALQRIGEKESDAVAIHQGT